MGKEDLDVETDYVKRKINSLLLAIDDARQLEEYEKLVLLSWQFLALLRVVFFVLTRLLEQSLRP